MAAPAAVPGAQRPVGAASTSSPASPKQPASSVAAVSTPPASAPSSSAPAPPHASQRKFQAPAKAQPAAALPVPVVAAIAASAAVALAAGVWGFVKLIRRGKGRPAGQGSKGGSATKGPCSNVKPTSRCVPLADGSACVVRRPIPADNSCLFNAVGYVMHHSKTKATFLRSVVAREVSSDPQHYTDVFLGMSNVAYCSWIMNRTNWGGGIELAILAKHYGREIAAYNIETARGLVFGEEAGYAKQVMLIYNGIHYDSLAVSPGPRASEEDDVTEFNPRTKRGKMIMAAAQKLVELTHKGKKFVSNSASPKLECGDCKAVFKTQSEAGKHAQSTGHVNFKQVK